MSAICIERTQFNPLSLIRAISVRKLDIFIHRSRQEIILEKNCKYFPAHQFKHVVLVLKRINRLMEIFLSTNNINKGNFFALSSGFLTKLVVISLHLVRVLPCQNI